MQDSIQLHVCSDPWVYVRHIMMRDELVCCINHHRPFILNTATLLPVVYRVRLKNVATMVDVDSLHVADWSPVGLLRRRRRPQEQEDQPCLRNLHPTSAIAVL